MNKIELKELAGSQIFYWSAVDLLDIKSGKVAFGFEFE